MRVLRNAASAGTGVMALLAAVTPAAASQGPGRCADDAPVTVEERRLELPQPREVLHRSGFDAFAPALAAALCDAADAGAAERSVTEHGRALWDAAVARAQGRRPAGTLPAIDDRPLYWARLQLTSALRRWTPSFPLDGARRAGLLDRLETASRGQDPVAYPGSGRRILVSGFDPFQLDLDVRRSNPSGVAALALDGTVVETAAGPARIEAVVFPVSWGPFTDGVVERTFMPRLAGVDLFTTVSQGSPGVFELERHNGRWRGGFPGNDGTSSTGTIPVPPGVPTVLPPPEFVSTTLPYAEIVAAPTGRFPVVDDTSVVEIPSGGSGPVFRVGGPTPGSTARAGGGGDYLSNEVAYRATLLRDALGLRTPGGHLHTPVLEFGPGNVDELTDPAFEANQRDIADQVRAVLVAGLEATARADPGAVPGRRPME